MSKVAATADGEYMDVSVRCGPRRVPTTWCSASAGCGWARRGISGRYDCAGDARRSTGGRSQRGGGVSERMARPRYVQLPAVLGTIDLLSAGLGGASVLSGWPFSTSHASSTLSCPPAMPTFPSALTATEYMKSLAPAKVRSTLPLSVLTRGRSYRRNRRRSAGRPRRTPAT